MSNIRSKGSIPPRWLGCPRKSDELIGGRFLAIKTPLDSNYDDQVPIENRFYPSMVFSSMKSYKVQIGLWIDLTNTSRFYNKRDIEKEDCRYLKLQCRGHGETPSPEQVRTFIEICKSYSQQNPLKVIIVHCTHGFNRTGFMICSYLIETDDWSPEASLATFARARAPGIYKEDYINELFSRYGDIEDAPEAPVLPDWCFDNETDVDEDGNPVSNGISTNNAQKTGKVGKFMEGVPGVQPFVEYPAMREIQNKIRKMCNFRSNDFPGSQPVSMDRNNISLLASKSYSVSWKADGTRYMMLIDGPDRVFFVDRDNCLYHVSNLTFLYRKDENEFISNTLLDGEMVIDRVGDVEYPRYLVYDIVKFRGVDVGRTDFGTRMLCIEKEIVGARTKFIQEGKINRMEEPFGVRQKQFWDVSETRTLLGPKFTKEVLGHEPDGLIFQPTKEPYTPGTDKLVLKWKPHTHNSIDFKLSIVKEEREGMCGSYVGRLFVGGCNNHFAEMKVNKALREYNNKIIECNYVNGQWKFMRERTDKSFPNALRTAESVMKSILQPVTEEILLDFIEHSRFNRDASLMPPPPAQKRRRLH